MDLNPTATVVLGIGNILNRDEGVGVRALDLLQRRLGEHTEVDLIDGGVLGLELLPIVERAPRLLILDAVDAGRAPGIVVELQRDEIPLFASVKMSQHQVTFQEVLGLASIRESIPEQLHLVGIQPADVTIGIELSDVVAAALPLMVERAARIVVEWSRDPAGAIR